MKICLLIPPAMSGDKVPERVYGCAFTYYRQPELPLLYVASVLRADGHQVEMLDFTDATSGDFKQWLPAADHDLIVLHTVLLSGTIDRNAAAAILRQTTARVIFYGPHPTLFPQRFLLSERCFVARGEAEYVIRDLVRALGERDIAAVRGISYLERGRLVEHHSFGIIDDLDSLPFPARELLPAGKDFANPKLADRPVTLVLTSRGCSFRCSYCVPNAISWARELEWRRFHDGAKPPVRLRSPGNLAAEFAQIKATGYRAVSVIDDMFLFGGKQRILDVCQGLAAVGLPFGALARCDFVQDEDIVAALAAAGCRYLDLGIESLDQAVLDDVHKGIDSRAARRAVDLLNKHGIEPKANIMFGASPLETPGTIDSTITGITKYPIRYCMFSIATPFPGTEFDRRMRESGWAVRPEIDDLERHLSPTRRALVSYPGLSKAQLERAVRRANRAFYLNPARVWFQLRRIRSLRGLYDLVATGLKVIR